MRIKIVSVPVRDQQKALDFYTEKLGFVKKLDTPLGGGNRWLTVVSRYDQDGPEILLEPAPLHFEPARVFQDELKNSLYDQVARTYPFRSQCPGRKAYYKRNEAGRRVYHWTLCRRMDRRRNFGQLPKAQKG